MSMKYIAILLGALSTTAQADTFRCGQTLLVAGKPDSPTWYEVKAKCGKPKASKGYRWVYEAPNKTITVLVFNDIGQLVAVHKGY